MKNSLSCPKCSSRKLWQIDPLRTTYEYSPGTIPLHMSYKQSTGTGWLDSPARVGVFTAYVCAACGYSELWAEGFEELRPDPEQGIRLIDGSQGRPEGYR